MGSHKEDKSQNKTLLKGVRYVSIIFIYNNGISFNGNIEFYYVVYKKESKLSLNLKSLVKKKKKNSVVKAICSCCIYSFL